MNINIIVDKQDPDITSLKMEGDLTMYSVHEVKKSFLDNLKSSSKMNIFLSDIKKIDTSGFQLLLLVKYESKERDVALEFIDPSPEVKHIFKLYGESI